MLLYATVFPDLNCIATQVSTRALAAPHPKRFRGLTSTFMLDLPCLDTSPLSRLTPLQHLSTVNLLSWGLLCDVIHDYIIMSSLMVVDA